MGFAFPKAPRPFGAVLADIVPVPRPVDWSPIEWAVAVVVLLGLIFAIYRVFAAARRRSSSRRPRRRQD
jgi:hypothetical protein